MQSSFLRKLISNRGSLSFGLEGVKAILCEIGNPHIRCGVVHVAGTNGKGSVCAMISSILGSAGYSVGLTISPHLTHYTERIVINGKSVDEELLADAARSLQVASERLGIAPSFHEGMTILAFILFQECDWVVLETGLGGTSDSTNVVPNPELTLITSIGLDHQHVLGHSLAEIAAHKAGIIKAGVPCVVGELPPQAVDVVTQRCESMNSHLYQSGVSFEAVSGEDPSIVFRGEFHQQYREFKYKMNLNGQHQVRNSALAVAATSLLGIDIASQQIGLTTAFWPGRCELLDIKDRRAVLLDAAHNPDGMQSLCNYLKSSLRTSCDVIFSALEGKDWRVMVDILAPHIVNWHLVTAPHSAGVPAQVLGDYLREKSPSCSVMVHTGCPKECYRSLVANTVDRLLLVTGSMYLLGAVRPLIVKSDKVLWRRGSTPASADLLN